MESTPMGWEIIERWRYMYNFFFNCSQMTLYMFVYGKQAQIILMHYVFLCTTGEDLITV